MRKFFNNMMNYLFGYGKFQRKQARLWRNSPKSCFSIKKGDPIIIQTVAFINPNKGINTINVYYNGISLEDVSLGQQYVKYTGYDGTENSPVHITSVRFDKSNQLKNYNK